MRRTWSFASNESTTPLSHRACRVASFAHHLRLCFVSQGLLVSVTQINPRKVPCAVTSARKSAQTCGLRAAVSHKSIRHNQRITGVLKYVDNDPVSCEHRTNKQWDFAKIKQQMSCRTKAGKEVHSARKKWNTMESTRKQKQCGTWSQRSTEIQPTTGGAKWSIQIQSPPRF